MIDGQKRLGSKSNPVVANMNMNMKSGMRKREGGFSLIDALIGAVVLALGLLAIATFNTRLVSDSGLSKNRSVAVALAQEKMEELRTSITEDVFEGLVSGADDAPLVFGNGSFSRNWSIADHGAVPNSRNITVNVSWASVRDGDQQITLSSVVSWDNPVMQFKADNQTAFNKGGSIPVPTGGGELYWGDRPEFGDGDTIENNEDYGITVVEWGDGVAVYDSNNNLIWMTVSPGVIKIAGTIKLYGSLNQFSAADLWDDPETINHEQRLRSIAADAGICREKYEDNGTTDGEDSTDDDYLSFVCYVGKRWYGRVGVMAITDEGRMIQVDEYGSGSKDKACPRTYRYGDSCDVTGEHTIDGVLYCDGYGINPDFTPGESVLLAGTLGNQDFYIQTADSVCFDSILVTGEVTVEPAGSANASINANGVTATPSGTAFGCTVTQSLEDERVGSFVCEVPLNWGADGETIVFAAHNCDNSPITHDFNTALTSDHTDSLVGFTGCIQDSADVIGIIANYADGYDPRLRVVGQLGNVAVDIVCRVEPVVVEGLSYGNYICDNVPLEATGNLVLGAANCDVDEQLIPSLPAGLESGTSVTGPSMTLSNCGDVSYDINGLVSKTAGKWEVGSGNEKLTITQAEIYVGESRCATVYLDGDNNEFTCRVPAAPGSSVEMRVEACDLANRCLLFSNNPATVPLGNENPIIVGPNTTFILQGWTAY